MLKRNLFMALVATVLSASSLAADNSEMSITLNPTSSSKASLNNSSKSQRSPSSEKPTSMAKDYDRLEKDLDSELTESRKKTKVAGQKMRPAELKKGKNKKAKRPRVISEPSETINVPDSVQWGHHLKNQEQNAAELDKMNEAAIKELGSPIPEE